MLDRLAVRRDDHHALGYNSAVKRGKCCPPKRNEHEGSYNKLAGTNQVTSLHELEIATCRRRRRRSRIWHRRHAGLDCKQPAKLQETVEELLNLWPQPAFQETHVDRRTETVGAVANLRLLARCAPAA